jgi:protein-L-isoaspartate(D-aspartate) O-methyltransferase
MSWLDAQLARRGISDPRVLDAMRRVPRELFVPEEARAHAYDDAALALPCGQTISQPYVVALICQGLALIGGERVLDVGTGSGYQAAVLAELGGAVVSIERIPELSEQARLNLEAAGYADRVELRTGDGSEGAADRAPFDAIAVAAAAADVPSPLVEQLAEGGRLILPLGNRYEQRLELVGRAGPRLWRRSLAPVRFVPLVS